MINRANRFNNRNELLSVLRKGKNVRAEGFSVRSKPSSQPKVAVVVSKKVSKQAVTRNRIRRRLFEVVHQQIKDSGIKNSVVIIVHEAALADRGFANLTNQLSKVIK
ncbi:ribonuclease P protein component [Candidatus Saccharibacteria bacterium]|nr:ribonuclease P protein component [Candidatus Saccharibacteria bacterium]